MKEGRKFFPGLRWVLLAAVAGILAGLSAVYVGQPQAGNGALPETTAADAGCAAKAAKAKTVGAAAVGEVAAVLPADPPRALGSLAFEDGTGKRITVGDFSGKTVLLNLWATWCAPCRAEMPALDRLQAEAGNEKFEVVAVNVDTGGAEKPKTFLEETGVKALAPYRDDSLELFNDLKARGLVLGLPATFVIDRDGCMLAGLNGPAEWASADARKLISAVLTE